MTLANLERLAKHYEETKNAKALADVKAKIALKKPATAKKSK